MTNDDICICTAHLHVLVGVWGEINLGKSRDYIPSLGVCLGLFPISHSLIAGAAIANLCYIGGSGGITSLY